MKGIYFISTNIFGLGIAPLVSMDDTIRCCCLFFRYWVIKALSFTRNYWLKGNFSFEIVPLSQEAWFNSKWVKIVFNDFYVIVKGPFRASWPSFEEIFGTKPDSNKLNVAIRTSFELQLEMTVCLFSLFNASNRRCSNKYHIGK